MTTQPPAFSREELLVYVHDVFPQTSQMGLEITAISRQALTVKWPTNERHLRPGGTVSGPSMMTLADTAMYFLVLANCGPVPLAVTTNLNMHFLRKPAPGDLVAEATMLKLGSRLAVGEVSVRTSAKEEIVAHATVTYSVPPR